MVSIERKNSMRLRVSKDVANWYNEMALKKKMNLSDFMKWLRLDWEKLRALEKKNE